ncbi:restriction endonuclease subunit S [Pasteurella multocida]|uniref:restriction endonuclease subunit S n=5 Tax=Pasteurella multocida TaxID=747 RepID=UPI0009F61B4D|nr:restriction endonuclease subunit S [Pasteurella multocida]PNM03747.1 restriction endonuclease subunit S [Pasteurella multocida]QDA12713.1 restriction endonuclease subunit S [Pasteurella multocida subsp. multocida]
MNNKKSSVPKLRFPEFTDAWEQRKLGIFIQDYIEKTTVQNQYPVLTSSQKQGIVLQEDYFADRQITNENNIGYFVLPKGFFTYRSRSDNGIFRFNRNDLIDKGIISYFYPVFEIINGDSNFFLYLLNSTIDKQVALEAEGTGQRVLSLKKFKKINIIVPNSKEQQKIGSFFTALDRLITTHQRKLENVKKLKKSLLQKMFPKNGQEFPEIRFPEFTDAWEQRKLGKLADFNPRSNLPDEFKYVDLESVVGTELTGYRFENKLSAPSRAQRLAQKGDIFYQTVRPYQKNNYLFEFEDENFVFSTGYAQLRPLINGRFLFSKLQEDRFVQQVLDKCTGTSYPAINSSDLSEIKVYIPDNKQEQQKIGSFFTALDRLITTHQRKLENVKKLKKALLQQMFV